MSYLNSWLNWDQEEMTKKAIFTMSYKAKEMMESNDLPSHEWRWHLRRKRINWDKSHKIIALVFLDKSAILLMLFSNF